MGAPTQVCVRSCPNISAPAGRPFRMSTPVFVDPESSTQADGAQSSRVPMPLPEDPYEDIRHAYLDGTDTESEPFEDPLETETPESPLTIAPPISLSESIPLILVPILCRTARMAVHVPPVMSSDLSASMAEVAAMSESAFLEDSEEDDDEEDEEIEESIDSDSMSEDAEDEDPAARDESLAARVEGPGMDDESYGLDDESHEEEEAVPRGQQQATLVMGIAVSAPLGLGYRALRHRELALEEDDVYNTFEVGQSSGSAPESEGPERVSTFKQPTLTTWTDPKDGMVYIDVPTYPPPAPPVQTLPSLEWTSGLLPISPSPSVIPSPVSSPMIPLTIPSPIATPATAETEGFLTELGAQVEMQGGLIRDHTVQLEELSPALFERYDRDIGEIFTRSGQLGMRFSPRGQTDAQRAALWHAISDVQRENQDLRLQLAEERRAQLELAEVVDDMRRGQEPRGGA
ncbi:hypothetical protein Tco_0111754 [Tanacetum coccineum]